MDNYDEIIGLTISGFCSPKDVVVCRYVFKKPNQTCFMCGKHPISWNYVLYNVDTGDRMVVGSECVVNFSRVAGQPLVFPKEYAFAVDFINKKVPNAARIADYDLLQTIGDIDFLRAPILEDDGGFRRQMYDDLGLDPDNPNVWELAPDDLDPTQFDWESWDYE